MTVTETRALALPKLALQVDAAEAEAFAGQLIKHAHSGAALFPKDLTQSQAVLLARIAIAYGLDPIAGEVIPYQGRQYVTIEGRTRIAQNHPAYDGIEVAPASDAERKAFRCGDDEHLWVARVWRKDRRSPFVGYGRSAGKSDKNPVSQTYGQEMAQKRAKHRAFRDAFALPFPDFEDDGATQQAYPQYERTENYEPAGDVIDGEARVIDDATGEVPADESNTITASQVTVLHTLSGLLKWEDDQYRGLLHATFDVDSSLDLTEGQAAALVECFQEELARAQEEGRAARVAGVVERLKAKGEKLRDWDDDGPVARTNMVWKGYMAKRDEARTTLPDELLATLPIWQEPRGRDEVLAATVALIQALEAAKTVGVAATDEAAPSLPF